jgi:hypothetical protein
MRGFREYVLGPKANGYIGDCLEYGHSLTRHLRRGRDLVNGRVVTRLAPEANTDELDKFEWGGKYPESSIGRHPNSVDDLASYILDFLQSGEGRICVFENHLGRRTDPWLLQAESRVHFFGEEVYHVVSAEVVDLDSIKAAINEAEDVTLLIGVLSVWPEGSRLSPERREITDEELRALAEGAEKIIVRAYDGEGYLIWTKR